MSIATVQGRACRTKPFSILNGWVGGILGMLILLPSPYPLYSADDPASRKEAKPKEPEQESDFVNPGTAVLRLLVGTWRSVEVHFDDRGATVGKSSGTEEITWVADHHAILRRYSSSTDLTRYRAVGTLAYNDFKKTYQSAWVDSASTTGPTVLEGEWDVKNKSFTFELARTAADGAALRYKVVERFDGPETRTVTTYLLKGSTLIRQIEVTHTRTAPCPPGLRTYLDH